MRHLFAVALALGVAASVSAAEPAAPGTRGEPSVPPVMPKPQITVAQFLEKLPGKWTGTQYMISPKKQVMSMKVTEIYRWETGKDGIRVLVGELAYVIGADASAKTFTGVSRTWVDKDGRAHAEVEEHGKVVRFDARMREDTLTFIPEGSGEKPTSGTGVRVISDKDGDYLSVRGFQTGPDGVYLVEGKLLRAK